MTHSQRSGESEPRVLFISRKWPPAIGGMEEFSFQLAEAMKPLARVHLVVLPGRASGLPPTGFGLLVFLFRAVGSLVSHGRRSDLIILGDFVLSGLAVCSRLVAPHARTVVVVHGLDLLYARRSGLLPMLYRGYLRIAVRLQSCLDAVVANSRSTAQVARGLGMANVATVRLGVQLPVDEPSGALKRDRRRILFVGRLIQRKGAGWFAQEVIPLLGDSELVVVGPASDATELDRLEEVHGVRYLGMVDALQLRSLRNESWIAVVPNIDGGPADMEGFGLTAIEAAAEGCVVIGSNIEGVSDAIIDGQTGFHAPAGDSARWSELILEIQAWDTEQYDEFTGGARRALAEHYSWERVAAGILQVGLGESRRLG